MDQDSMYFITGSSIEEVQNSPFVEELVARGYEVLYMVELIDEMLVQHMPGHGGKIFKNIAKGDFNFVSKFLKLIDHMQSTLIDQVEKIEVSARLMTSPCAVVATDWGRTGNMEKITTTQPFKQENPLLKEFNANQKKIPEINPLILGLLDKVKKDVFDADTKQKEMVRALYETTLIRSKYSLKDYLKYAARVEADKSDDKPKVETKNLFEEQDNESTGRTKPARERNEL